MTTTTELTLPQRAAVALGAAEHEKKLILLAEEAKTITEIKNKDGRDQCHSMMMTLKNTRVAIEKTGKAAREDAKNFANAVIAEEKRLIAITEAEEARLQNLRDQWDAKIEAERQAKIEAERRRVAAIRAEIDGMKNLVMSAVGMDSSSIDLLVTGLNEKAIGESFAEFGAEAQSAKDETHAKLHDLFVKKLGEEAEADRLKAEREELARLRAEAEARRKEDERIAAEKRAAEEAALKAERDKQEAELAAQRAEIARQQAERDAEAAAQAKAAREAQEAAEANLAAERAVLEAERAEIERQKREAAEEAAKQSERERLAKLCREFVANAKAQSTMPTEWAYSFNEENYEGQEPTIEAAMAEALEEADDREVFWIGRCKQFIGRGDADSVVERLQEQCYDECGEYGETYLDDVTKEELQELEDFITAWAARVDRSTFYTIEGAQKFTVEEARKLLEAESPVAA